MATKNLEMTTKTLEMAPAPVNFLESEYFRGLCEIASACATETPLFIPQSSFGLFQSLYFKRIFARSENKDGSYTVGNFQMKNRYLYNYDRYSDTYTDKKENNFNKFIEVVKEIVNTKEYKVFSTEKVKETTLKDLVAL